MITGLAKSTAHFFVENKLVEPDDEEIYVYGMEIFLSTAINLIIAVVIALVSDTFIPCLINFTAFVTIRIYAGGYHADTHLGCIMTLIAVQNVFILVIKNITESLMLLSAPIMMAVSAVVIFSLSVVEHPNKPLSVSLRKKLRKKSLAAMLLWLVFITVFIQIDMPAYGFYAAFGMISISAAMAAEKLKLRFECNEKK